MDPRPRGDMTEQVRIGCAKRELWAGLAIVAVMVIVLRSAGRRWWCACATPMFWIGDVNSSHLSQHLFDPYSFSHLLHGVIFFWVLKRLMPHRPTSYAFIAALLLEAGWEVLENSSLIIDRYRQSTMALNYYGDSIVNSFGDMLSCALGFLLAASGRWFFSVALFLTVEIGMLALYRDNLTLNVLMLTYPSERVKRWQMGAGDVGP